MDSVKRCGCGGEAGTLGCQHSSLHARIRIACVSVEDYSDYSTVMVLSSESQ
jgi:hypothetical protein